MIKIALMASGRGSNVLNLLTIANNLFQVKIPLVIINNRDSNLPEEIKSLQLKCQPDCKIVPFHADDLTYLTLFKEYDIQWCFLAGFMKLMSGDFLQYFKRTKIVNGEMEEFYQVVNIHPSLLPKYPGLNAYEKSFKAEEKVNGVTLHFVNEKMDEGPIINQMEFKREIFDTWDSFLAKGKNCEWKLYGDFLKKLDRDQIHDPSIFRTLILKEKNSHQHQVFWVFFKKEFKEYNELKKIAPFLIDEVNMELISDLDYEKSISHTPSESFQVIHYKAGLTDNPARSFFNLLNLQNVLKGKIEKVRSGILLEGEDESSVKSSYFYNPLIQKKYCNAWPREQDFHFSLDDVSTGNNLEKNKDVKSIKLNHLSNNELNDLSKKKMWALSIEELHCIRNYYEHLEVKNQRTKSGLPLSPTEIEMEVFAQTWSEHCKHKIFSAYIDYEDEGEGESFSVDGLFSTYIQAPTFKLLEKKSWAISVFKDNAGIVRFHPELDLCIKVETHNSPSALDPYGGALTGLLGVHRDILGTGLGAKPVANSNALLFGPPDFSQELPLGLHHPKDIFQGVHRGIQDGGNKSGVPTVNGSIQFHENFCGKPLVFCGSVGVLPAEIKNIPTHLKSHQVGDLIVMVGGAVGIDGLHGATLSSIELNQSTPLGMVQIGDPYTQKILNDFLMSARDKLLYNSITDNGAGGLSSSIGEMAEKTNGAIVYLHQVPLKYPGLLPWQIFLSESQERMTLSVSKKNIVELNELARLHGVLCAVVGEFTDTGYLELFYEKQIVGNIKITFLHGGLPQKKLKAKWDGYKAITSWLENDESKKKNQDNTRLDSYYEKLIYLAGQPNLASKEKWIRQFDHEVQGATAGKPFGGLEYGHSSPNDAAVIWLGAHASKKYNNKDDYLGAVISSGICPFYAMDAGLMAKMAVDEAVRNALAVGANPEKMALLDNFSWPDPLPDPLNEEKNPDAHHKLAQLVRAARSLRDMALAYEMPFISGKDSMKNDFHGKWSNGSDVKISVIPTLLITALAEHGDVRRVLQNRARVGEHIFLLGKRNSREENYFGISFPWQSVRDFPWDLNQTRSFYKRFYDAQESSLFQGAHDISEGGLLFALFEMFLFHKVGIELDLETLCLSNEKDSFLFSEYPGKFIVSVSDTQRDMLQNIFHEEEILYLGESIDQFCISIKNKDFNERILLDEVEKKWRSL